MFKLNVICDKCNKGNLCLPDGYCGLDDYYEVHCTNCSYVFTTHYTGMDSILSEHEYNNQVGKDVKLLNQNGSWWQVSGSKMKGKQQFEDHVKNARLIQVIDADFTNYYYQSGANFFMIEEMPYGGEYIRYNYKAKNDEAVMNLINHFFKQGA